MISISGKTLVTFLLDRSGSMGSIKAQTIEAFNGYLDGLKAEKDASIDFTLVQFDTQGLQKDCVRKPIHDVDGLTSHTYEPRGGTPLIEAAFKTINAVAASLSTYAIPPKVVINIQTDGEENSSAAEYTMRGLNTLIKEKVGIGWQFNFMGCGIDAYAQGAQMGISALNTMSYDRHDAAATRTAFVASSTNTAAFAAGRSRDTSYSAQQRKATKDAFAHRAQDGLKPDPDIPYSFQPLAPLPSDLWGAPLDLTTPPRGSGIVPPPITTPTADDFTL